MGALQPWHLIILLVIVLIIWGPKNLPTLGKMLGNAMKEFHSAKDGLTGTDEKTAVKPADDKAAATTPENKTPAAKA